MTQWTLEYTMAGVDMYYASALPVVSFMQGLQTLLPQPDVTDHYLMRYRLRNILTGEIIEQP